jgi:hypothetical protein
MKNLTKVFLVAMIVSFATESFAQVNFGIKAGVNLANMIMKDDDNTYSDDYKSKLGFQVGPVVEFGFNDMISLETGLLLSTKGYKVEDSGSDMGINWEYDDKINIMYLNIPVNARVGFGVGGMRIYGAVGPYFGVGLSGKYKGEYTLNGETEEEEEDLDFGNDEDESDLKRLDYGLSIGAGAAFGAFEVGLNYDLGLANLSPNTENGNKINNRVFSITAAYKFGK